MRHVVGQPRSRSRGAPAAERFAGRRREVLAGLQRVIVGMDAVQLLGTYIGVSVASGGFVGPARLTAPRSQRCTGCAT